VVANDIGERPECLIYGRGVREDLGHVGLKDHDVTTSHAGGIGVTPPSTEIVLGQDVIRVDARGAPNASLLHSLCVRDESLSER